MIFVVVSVNCGYAMSAMILAIVWLGDGECLAPRDDGFGILVRGARNVTKRGRER